MNRFGKVLGAKKTGASVYEVPTGQSISPYHYEYPEEEWLLVLSGSVALRHPGGEDTLVAGDMVFFPVGPDGAHKVTNTSEEDARILMFSTVDDPAIAVYPDSDKLAFFSGNDTDRGMVRREDAKVEYFDREP